MFRRLKASETVLWHCVEFSRGARKGAKLPVVLSKDIESLGPAGGRVAVNQGFAHNWLFPQKLAKYDLEARHGSGGRRTPGAPTAQESVDQVATKEQKHLERIARRLFSSPVTIKRKFRRGEILEGQVTKASVVDAIAKQKRVDIAQDLVELEAPILTHGTFEVPTGIVLPSGAKGVLKVQVAP